MAGPLTVEWSRAYHREWLVKFVGADSREALEPWRGLFLAAPADELAPPEGDEVYLHELEGFSVRLADGTPLGLVSGVYELPAGLMIEVRGPSGSSCCRTGRSSCGRSTGRGAGWWWSRRRGWWSRARGESWQRSRSDGPGGWRYVGSRVGPLARRATAGVPAMLTIDVVTLFPEVIAPFLAASIPGRAAAAGLVQFSLVQLRDFTHDRHQTVDDYAYGGGAGMVLKPEPFFEAVESLRAGGDGGAADRRGAAVQPRRRGAVLGGPAADAALRALQGRGPAGGRGAGHRGAVGRGFRAVGRRAGGALRAGRRGAAPAGRPGRPRVGQLATRTTTDS